MSLYVCGVTSFNASPSQLAPHQAKAASPAPTATATPPRWTISLGKLPYPDDPCMILMVLYGFYMIFVCVLMVLYGSVWCLNGDES